MGKVDCVVVDPQTKDVTHLVVCEGRLLSEDKVIPLVLIETGSTRYVLLKCDTDELHTLMTYDSAYYLPWDHPESLTCYSKGYAPSYFWYPPTGEAWWNTSGYHTFLRTPEPLFTAASTPNPLVEYTIPLAEGMDGIGAEGYTAGQVQHLYTDLETSRVTHIVIGQSPLFADHRLVPSCWIDALYQDMSALLTDVLTLGDLPVHTGKRTQ